MSSLLAVSNLIANYGKKRILHGISFKLNPGEILGFLGHNGAGKTTTLKAIAGLLPDKSGQILFSDKSIVNLPIAQLIQLGIRYCPQGGQVFPTLSVKDNLLLAGFRLKTLNYKIKDIFDLLPLLNKKQFYKAGFLSGGERQILSIGMSLMTEPNLLLLDEPFIGLAPIIIENIYNIIAEINKQGVSIIICEQNLGYIKNLVHRAYILKGGLISNEIINLKEVDLINVI